MNTIKIALQNNEPPKECSIARFEELFQIKYFPQLEFQNWKVERWLRRKCAWAHNKGNIGQLALWLGKLHGQQIAQGLTADVTIRWIDEHIGYGAFTNKPLKKWEYIGEYTGLLRQRRLLFPDINDYCFMYPKEWWSLKSFTIDGDKQGNCTRFINHSDTPNCESVSVYHDGLLHIIFRTTQKISAGTQLTYDYGDIYWRRRKKLPPEPIESLICPDDLKLIKQDT